MPDIKNGQYADVILQCQHTGESSDRILQNKYYRFDREGRPYVVYKGKRFYIEQNCWKDRFYRYHDFLSTGEVTKHSFYMA